METRRDLNEEEREKMKKILFAFLFLSFAVIFAEAKELTTLQFVAMLRNPPGRESWGILTGTASHRRRGSDTAEAPIRFSVLFTKARTIAQIVFNGRTIYDAAQSYTAPYASSIEIRDPNEKVTLKDFGLRPEDLAMNFIFWNFRRELGRESIRSVPCRILTFEAPSCKESVKVFVSAEHCFPIRVEWFNTPEKDIAGKPFRTLEAASFKKCGDLWVVGSLSIWGSGWRTTVKFPDAEAGLSKDGIAKNLFL